MAGEMGCRLASMPIHGGMEAGMALIILGLFVAAYGLLPRNRVAQSTVRETSTSRP